MNPRKSLVCSVCNMMTVLRRSLLNLSSPCALISSASYFHKNAEPISLLLQKSSASRSIADCRQLHAELITSGMISLTYVANTLLCFYSRCTDLVSAHLLFDQMTERNVVSWTSLISGYAHHGQYGVALCLFKEMLGTGESPNQFTLSIAVRACICIGFMELGLQIHGLVIHLGFENDEFSGCSLVDMYSKVGGCIDNACQVFSRLDNRDTVMWNVMISAFAQANDSSKVCELLREMRIASGLFPNDFTFASMLKCCSSVGQVEQIHGLAVKHGTELDVVVSSALVDMYGKCGSLELGLKHLHSMKKKDKFLWSSIISGYAKRGFAEEAILLFKDMCRDGVAPDQHALSGAMKACAESGNLKTGLQFHVLMIKNGYQSDCIISSVLLNLYAYLRLIDEAEIVFKRIDDKDLVAWNSMILCYAQMDDGPTSATMLFKNFCRTSILKPDGATFIALLKSCQTDEDIAVGAQIHARFIKSRLQSDTALGNATIHMYSKCRSVGDALKAFNEIVHKDDISWSSMIGTYQQHGMEVEALALCKEMLSNGISLTTYSLPSSIAACSEQAAIDVGKQFHSLLIKSGLDGDLYVGSSFIDMYAKCGNMEDSRKFFDEENHPNEVTYNALISGFAQHGKAQEAIAAFNEMEKNRISPNKVTFLSILMACSHAGLLEESLYFFQTMSQKYEIKPEREHFSCLVDVFGRDGRIEEALKIIEFDGGPSGWRTLLSACKNYSLLDITEPSMRNLLDLDPNDDALYVLLSNLLSGVGKWEKAFKVRREMANAGVKKDPGGSWLIFRDQVHEFLVGDYSHREMEEILDRLRILYQHMYNTNSWCITFDSSH